MTRLIDADELMKFPIRLDNYDKEHGNEHFVLGIESVLEYVEQLPTVDAVPVVHGRWENFGEHRKMDLRCSVCNKRASNFVGGTEDWWDMWKPNYCPNCGAKMDLEEDND